MIGQEDLFVIETIIFKECVDVLARPLTDLFNSCLKNNFMPDEWKLAHLTPYFKKGSKSDETLLAIRISNLLLQKHKSNI